MFIVILRINSFHLVPNLLFRNSALQRFDPKIPIRERSHMTSAAEGGGGFEMLTRGGGGGLSLADVSKNTKILANIVSNQACLTLCVRLLH